MVVKQFRVRCWFTILFVCVGSWALTLPSVGQEQTAAPAISEPLNIGQVDFDKSILPILKQRCFECHAGDRPEGDLRLDSRAGMQTGGHTGNTILAATPADSELFRRIISTEDGYRMPKEGGPLSDEQIEIFRDWIIDGANWPAATVPPARPFSLIEYLGEVLNRFNTKLEEPRFKYLSYLAWPFLAWFLFSLAYYLIRLRSARNSDITQSNWLNGLVQVLAVLLLAAIGGALYFFGALESADTRNRELVLKLEQNTRHVEVSLDPMKLTLPPYPMHPRRLGGIYYRGNDERSPELFNGGFYRTATMEIGLVDESGVRLQWEAKIPPRPLFISLVITRAPGTTPALFSDDVLKATFLRHYSQTELLSGISVDSEVEHRLDELEPLQKWSVRIPIDKVENWRDGIAEGIVYLFYGKQLVDGHKGRVHFGIKYRIQSNEGKIDSESELWMGSLYDLGGRVLVPREGEILLDHWFDFRPIPEIEGENATDPELLGIPEHVK